MKQLDSPKFCLDKTPVFITLANHVPSLLRNLRKQPLHQCNHFYPSHWISMDITMIHVKSYNSILIKTPPTIQQPYHLYIVVHAGSSTRLSVRITFNHNTPLFLLYLPSGVWKRPHESVLLWLLFIFFTLLPLFRCVVVPYMATIRQFGNF